MTVIVLDPGNAYATVKTVPPRALLEYETSRHYYIYAEPNDISLNIDGGSVDYNVTIDNKSLIVDSVPGFLKIDIVGTTYKFSDYSYFLTLGKYNETCDFDSYIYGRISGYIESSSTIYTNVSGIEINNVGMHFMEHQGYKIKFTVVCMPLVFDGWEPQSNLDFLLPVY